MDVFEKQTKPKRLLELFARPFVTPSLPEQKLEDIMYAKPKDKGLEEKIEADRAKHDIYGASCDNKNNSYNPGKNAYGPKKPEPDAAALLAQVQWFLGGPRK